MHIFQKTGPNAVSNVGLEIAAVDDGPLCGLQGTLTVFLPNGSYWFVMQGFGSSFGAYQVTVSCYTFSPTGSPTAAPTSGSTPSAAPTPASAFVASLTCEANATGTTTTANPQNWYMLTAVQQGVYTFNACGSSYDTYGTPDCLPTAAQRLTPPLATCCVSVVA
jgi:hypothetical protein